MIPESSAKAFAALAERVYATGDSAQVYRAVVDLAPVVVDGCDHACIMLLSRGVITTAAATSPVAAAIDDFEKALGEGPCLDAILDEQPQCDPDIATGSPWPRLAARVLRDTAVRGMIGFRLLVDGRKEGALNLFSETPGAFTATSLDQASVVAAFASVVLMTTSARQQAKDLSAGLASNREIGKAVGLLMAAHRVTEQEAFGILDRTSQDLNLKLAEVAVRVVEGQQSQVRPRTG
ncbi:MAG: GAF and ANTAR domain-containing protein [Dermatophilaceae bacterium]